MPACWGGGGGAGAGGRRGGGGVRDGPAGLGRAGSEPPAHMWAAREAELGDAMEDDLIWRAARKGTARGRRRAGRPTRMPRPCDVAMILASRAGRGGLWGDLAPLLTGDGGPWRPRHAAPSGTGPRAP